MLKKNIKTCFQKTKIYFETRKIFVNRVRKINYSIGINDFSIFVLGSKIKIRNKKIILNKVKKINNKTACLI